MVAAALKKQNSICKGNKRLIIAILTQKLISRASVIISLSTIDYLDVIELIFLGHMVAVETLDSGWSL
jgi:hypothetical protein